MNEIERPVPTLPAPKLDVQSSLPSLARRRESDLFLVARPGTKSFQSDATTSSKSFLSVGCGGGLLLSALLAWWWISGAGTTGGVIAAVVCAIIVGFGVSAVLATKLEEATTETATMLPSGAINEVTPHNPLAWNLSETMFRIAATDAWSQKIVDPARRCVDIHWAALLRANELAEREADVARSSNFPSLADLARDAAAETSRERVALEAIATNLGDVLRAADRLDATRSASALEQTARAEHEAVERELRGRLLRTSNSPDSWESDTRADESAGLAAETMVIADLLVRMDTLLGT